MVPDPAIAALLATAAWLLIAPVFSLTGTWPPALILLCALALAASTSTAPAPFRASRRLAASLALIAGACALIATRGRSPLWVVAALPFVVLAIRSDSAKRLPRASGAAAMLATFGFQAVFVLPLQWAWLRERDLPQAASLLGSVLRLLYDRVSVDGARLSIWTGHRTHELIAGWDTVGLYPALLYAIGLVPWLALRRPRWTGAITVLIVLPAYLLVRFVALTILFVALEQPGVFYDTGWVVLSLLPLAALLARLGPAGAPRGEPGPVLDLELARCRVAPLSLGLASGCLLGLGLAWNDPGVRPPQRILIDESHSDWEWTTIPLDRENYGVISMYNYRSLLEYLRGYYEVAQNSAPLTPDVLHGYDLLMVKMPTTVFSPGEIETVRQFVRGGGGLFLIGDHTNVFGTTSCANPLIAPYGIRFGYDATYDALSGGGTSFRPPAPFAHPIVQSVPRFTFLTSCTISAPFHARKVIVGSGLKAVGADYSDRGFFPRTSDVMAHPHRFGPFVQGTALQAGKGRVSLFSDSTIFSNFGMFLEGRPELLLGYVEWTGRSNRLPGVQRALLLLAALAAGAAFAMTAARGRAAERTALLPVALAGWCAGSLAAHGIDRSAYALPKPSRPPHEVAFNLSHSPAMAASFDNFPNLPGQITARGFNTFFIWMQRAGLTPRVRPTIAEGVASGRALVFVDPTVPFSRRDRALLDRYLHEGGTVLVLDELFNVHSTADEWLHDYGLELRPVVERKGVVSDTRGRNWGPIENFVSVRGGEGLLFTETGIPVAAAARVGKGTLIAFGAAASFSDVGLGYYKSVPTPDERRRADLLYDILERTGAIAVSSPLPSAAPAG